MQPRLVALDDRAKGCHVTVAHAQDGLAVGAAILVLDTGSRAVAPDVLQVSSVARFSGNFIVGPVAAGRRIR